MKMAMAATSAESAYRQKSLRRSRERVRMKLEVRGIWRRRIGRISQHFGQTAFPANGGSGLSAASVLFGWKVRPAVSAVLDTRLLSFWARYRVEDESSSASGRGPCEGRGPDWCAQANSSQKSDCGNA